MTRQSTNATAPGAAQTSRVAHSEGDAAGVVAPHPARTRQNARTAIGPCRPQRRLVPYGSMRHLPQRDKVLVDHVVSGHHGHRLTPRRRDALAHVAPDVEPSGVVDAVDYERAALGARLLRELAAIRMSERDRAIVMRWLDGDTLGDAGAPLSSERTRQIVLTALAKLRDRSPALRRVATPIADEPEWDWPTRWVAA